MTQRNGTSTRNRETIKFEPGIPVELALAYSQPKLISTQFGERYLFTLTDSRVMFLDPPQAALIAQLGINVRERFRITPPAENAEPWRIERIAGEQPNGTFAVPRCSPRTEAIPAAKPMQTAEQAEPSLADTAKRLVDVYAEVLAYGLEKHEGKVKPEEIRSILLSAYISQSKRGAA